MIILDLLHNLALLVSLAVVCQLIATSWRTHRLASQLLYGLLFGVVGVVGMMTPVRFMPGIIFDGRSIILSVGGLFGGPVVALISALLCGAYRLWLGGAGAAMGLSVIVASAAIGVAGHYWRRWAARPLGLLELWGFGLLVHGVMLGLMLLLPGGARQAVWNQLSLAIIGVYPVATVLICRLFLDYEKQRHDRTALQESEDKFKCFFEHANVGKSITRLSGELQVNQAFCDLLGYSPAELQHQSWQAITHPEDREPTQRVLDALLSRQQDSARLTKRFLHKNGSAVWADVSTALRRDPAGQPLYFMTAVIDITRNRQTEEELRRSNRALRLIGGCNQALVRAKDEAELLQSTCQIAVEQGGYRLAWIGFAEEDQAKSVRPVAQFGFEAGYLDTVNITWADTERGRGPSGTAIRTGQPVIARNMLTDPAYGPWREAALERGYASSIGLPLRSGGRCFGVLSFYAAEPDAFHAEEAKLLGELADDLAYGIDALRHRAERELVEAELERTAREWQTTFDATNDAIWILDNDHRVLRSNKTAERFFHQPCQKMIGEHCWAIVHGTTEPHPECPFIRARQSGHRETMELQQGERWCEVAVDPILDAAGQYAGAVHIVSDITQHKQAEEKLARNHEHYRRAITAASAIPYQKDYASDTYVFMGEGIRDLTGYAPSELRSAVWKEIVLETVFLGEAAGLSVAEAARLSVAGEIKDWRTDHRIRTRSGEIRWISDSSISVLDASGKYAGSMGIIQDITERKKAEKSLRDSEAQLRAVLDVTPFPIALVDVQDNNILLWSRSALNLFGHTAPTAAEWYQLAYPDPDYRREMIERWKPALEKARSSGQPVNAGEYRITCRDGLVRLCELYATFLADHLIVTFNDITERKRAEALKGTLLALTTGMSGARTAREAARIVFAAADRLWQWESGALNVFLPDGATVETVLRVDVVEGERRDVPPSGTRGNRTPRQRRIMAHGAELMLRTPEEMKVSDSVPFGDASRLSASLMCVPIRQQGQPVGILSIQSYRPNAFTPADLATLQGLADHCGGALERIQAEDALRQSEERFRSLVESAPEAIFVHSQGRFVYLNPAMLGLFGAAQPEELLGRDFMERMAPECREAVRERIRFQRDTGKPALYMEQEYVRLDGSRVPVETTAVAIQFQGGDAHLVFVRNITERKQAEERIFEQAALLDAANDAIYVRALDHTITYWNVGAERLYGWTRAEALGRKITDLGDAGLAAFEAAHATLLAQGAWSGEMRKTSKAGKEEVVFCRWTLLRDEQGRPREVLAINTDITEQKQMEANFLRIQRMEGIGALAGGIAHDLNNILAPILMVGQMLRETVTDPESRQMIETVEACARRGADIIKQLLTFARGKPGARAPLPVRHLLNEMQKIIRETFPRNIQPRINVPTDLWPILGDVTQIQQALMNLCVNARDALPEGGTLSLAADNVTLDETAAGLVPEAKPGEYVRVSVADTGTGIAPEHLERIFDPFFTTKEIGKGTGLGLATVLGIVRGHGGFVRVNSQVGQGTTFELYLPASPEAKAAGTPAAEARPPRGQGELILVVDDEVSVREILRYTLDKHGYRVIAAGEGAEALALFGQHPEIRGVITDMMMPGLDGPKLVQALRQLNARLPIVGMTGLAERAGVRGLEALNLPALLDKPFAAVSLLTALHEALAKSD